MKKILLFSSFILMSLFASAQYFTCDGTYVVTEPKEGLKIKECHVCVEETYAEIYIFEKEVVVPVVDRKHVNLNGMCGDVAYLDEDHLSYIFYGRSENTAMCMVSVVSIYDRWTFVRVEHEE